MILYGEAPPASLFLVSRRTLTGASLSGARHGARGVTTDVTSKE